MTVIVWLGTRFVSGVRVRSAPLITIVAVSLPLLMVTSSSCEPEGMPLGIVMLKVASPCVVEVTVGKPVTLIPPIVTETRVAAEPKSIDLIWTVSPMEAVVGVTEMSSDRLNAGQTKSELTLLQCRVLSCPSMAFQVLLVPVVPPVPAGIVPLLGRRADY